MKSAKQAFANLHGARRGGEQAPPHETWGGRDCLLSQYVRYLYAAVLQGDVPTQMKMGAEAGATNNEDLRGAR